MKTFVKIVGGIVGTYVVVTVGANIALTKSTKFRSWYANEQMKMIRHYNR